MIQKNIHGCDMPCHVISFNLSQSQSMNKHSLNFFESFEFRRSFWTDNTNLVLIQLYLTVMVYATLEPSKVQL